MISRILLCSLLAAVPLLQSCGTAPTLKPMNSHGMVSGVWRQGSNVTEPRPQRSEYLQVQEGGVAVVPKGTALFMTVVPAKPVVQPLYMTIDYEDPSAGTLRNTATLTPKLAGYTFSAPRSQPGLRPYRDYTVTVKLWKSKGDARPVDTLTQKIRSYVDTTGPQPQILSRLQPR